MGEVTKGGDNQYVQSLDQTLALLGKLWQCDHRVREIMDMGLDLRNKLAELDDE